MAQGNTAAPPHSSSSTGNGSAQCGCAHVRRRVASESLLGGVRELEIEHGGEVYRLRETRNGKLILTK